MNLEDYKASEKLPLVLVLDNIRSHHNVGSAFRTADALGVEKLILAGFTPSPPHREIQKTALGATLSVEWSHNSSIEELIKNLKNDGLDKNKFFNRSFLIIILFLSFWLALH